MFGPSLRLAVGPIVSRRVASSVRITSPGQVWRVPGLARTIVTKKYTPDHEWVSLDSETLLATISITHYAQSSLGDVVFVELPKVGGEVKAGEQIGAVESVKAASDIYAPISGVIEEVNSALDQQPSLLNKSPEGDGWLCKIRAANPDEMEILMTPEAYKEHCET